MVLWRSVMRKKRGTLKSHDPRPEFGDVETSLTEMIDREDQFEDNDTPLRNSKMGRRSSVGGAAALDATMEKLASESETFRHFLSTDISAL
ncbi:hypothetical protein JCGZ_19465 [Jatropha curcas]|uniref:Uncharacterized protein n=1 Tax=Jatropha curcas TaxID=180498 RepID=A0A067JVY5_JATCU|nr:hypothetical protein JCGZ_19465 [Jatropha curcas]